MLAWFNKKGVLKEQLDSYGNFPRVGSQDFQIIAYFDGLNPASYGEGYIYLQRPDFNGSKYPPIGMRKGTFTYEETDADGGSQYFVNGQTYPCWVFDFSSLVDNGDTPNDYTDDTILTLLDTPGLWKATIKLISDSGISNVVATMTFNVDGGEGSENPNEIDPSIMYENLVSIIARKLNITNGFVVLPSKSAVGSGYADGQFFYIVDENQFYKKVDGSLVEFNIFNPGDSYVTVEDQDYVIPPGEE